MAYIYKITNIINNKVYIGKTCDTIEARFQRHIYDSKKQQCSKRPLYNAMNKYGTDNFRIELVEECDYNNASLKEQYWIDKYRSYVGFDDSNGYNATLGGDGSQLCNYEWIYELWTQNLLIKDIINITNYDADTIIRALRQYNINHIQIKERADNSYSHCVAQIDIKTNEIINIYNSQEKAALSIGHPNCGGNIGRVCNGSRQTAYGYKWKWI